MKGIVLAGGSGSRLFPLTVSCNKQLLPVYDKPMIYYPLSTLIKLGIRDIRIVSSLEYMARYVKMFQGGEHLGLNITYAVQMSPRGLPEAFTLSEDLMDEAVKEDIVMVLGDNVFHGNIPVVDGPQIYAYKVKNPSDYAVVEFDGSMKVLSLIEKPKEPKTRYAVPGLYKLDQRSAKFSKTLKPSTRRELEITDLLKCYIDRGEMRLSILEEGFVWLDAGTPSMLYQASAYVQTIQERTGKKIGCIEADCYKLGFISTEKFKTVIDNTPKGEYKEYLETVL
jgi:glucose-1-phosphate thymidylyltransferase